MVQSDPIPRGHHRVKVPDHPGDDPEEDLFGPGELFETGEECRLGITVLGHWGYRSPRAQS